MLGRALWEEGFLMSEKNNYDIVNSVESLKKRIESVRAAQKEFSKFTQEKVDEIFFRVAMAANQKGC